VTGDYVVGGPTATHIVIVIAALNYQTVHVGMSVRVYYVSVSVDIYDGIIKELTILYKK
jgi:hypothetical protein